MNTAGDCRQRHRLLRIIQEQLLDAQGQSLVVEEDVTFKVVLKAPDIQIRRTAGDDVIVARVYQAVVDVAILCPDGNAIGVMRGIAGR